MSVKEMLIEEIEQAPADVLGEVLDFVRFLRTKGHDRHETAIASESSLAKDWLLPEEDDAWRDL
ncbi:MAG TPA: hypothetical protein VFE47_12630 [Tepidisphaeraceae bacterium]|jgi:hypothetical protein|nr:hypothetical protein [Tepidisphaeraceae bacterium]